MGTKVKKAIKYNTGITFRNSKIVITKSQYSKIGAYFPKDYELKSEYIYSYINTYDYIENLNQALSNTTHGFFENSNITFSLPFDQITVQKLSLPELNKRDLLSAINNQIDDLDEYFWTYRVLKSETQSQKGPNNILVIKIEKDIIEKYIKLFDKHKISLNSIVSEVDILEQFVSDLISNKIPKTMLAIDLENNFLKLSIFENNRMVFFRDVRLGFAEIIKPVLRKISYEGKEFEFDEEKAKEVLIENDIFDRKEKKDIPLDNIFFLLRPSLEKLVIEIQKTLQFYFKKSDSEINIASVLILGKLLQIKNVSSYFKESLNLPIEKPEFKANIVKIKHQNNISLQEAITMSAAASLETDNFSKTNLLPSYYITRKTHTSIVTILITFFLFWLLFILFLNVNYTKNIYTIKKKNRSNTKQIFLFEQKKTEISKQKKINIKKAKKIQFISETELNKLAVESLIYQLSLLDVKELYLTKVDITGSNILITGKIHKSKSQFLLTDYIDKLEKLPYISDIYFEIKKGDFEFSNFIIKGRLSGRARK